MFLVDTSAWILHFSSRSAFDLNSICAPDDRVICLPIYQEILHGIRDERTFRAMRTILEAATIVEDPVGRHTYGVAVDLYRTARKQGLTIRSSVDCLIAACAISHGLTVVHRDRDYSLLARVSSLVERSV